MFHNRDIMKQIGFVALGEALGTGIMLGVFALLGRFSLKVLWGGLIGAALALGNFIALCISVSRLADRTEATGEVGKAKLSIRVSWIVRMAVLFGLLFLLLKVGVCDPVATVLPLVFVRPSLSIAEFLRKDDVSK